MMAATTGRLESFDELQFGDRIVYEGPVDLEGEWAAPQEWKQPYRFKFVSLHGSLACATKFKGPKTLAPEHPANDPAHWRRVEVSE